MICGLAKRMGIGRSSSCRGGWAASGTPPPAVLALLVVCGALVLLHVVRSEAHGVPLRLKG